MITLYPTLSSPYYWKAYRQDGETELTHAVKKKDYSRIQTLSPYVNFNEANYFKELPLKLAMDQHDLTMIELLVNCGAALTHHHGEIDCPFFYGVSLGSKEIVSLCVNLGVDVNYHYVFKNALSIAVSFDNQDMVEHLVCTLNAQINTHLNYMILGEVAAKQNIPMLNLLIRQGMNVNSFYPPDTVPFLHLWIAKNKPKMRAIFKKAGADFKASREVINRKFLAHIWGIKQDSELMDSKGISHKFLLEFFSNKAAISRMLKCLRDFLYLPNVAISLYEKEEILAAFESSQSNSMAYNNFRLRLGKPVVIFLGIFGHCYGFVIHRDRIYKCDRNHYESIVSFKVSPEEIKRFFVDPIRTFNENLASTSLNYWVSKRQKGAFCAVTTPKAVIKLLFGIYRIPLYKEFTLFLRRSFKKQYLAESKNIDYKLLNSIYLKALSKANIKKDPRWVIPL